MTDVLLKHGRAASLWLYDRFLAGLPGMRTYAVINYAPSGGCGAGIGTGSQHAYATLGNPSCTLLGLIGVDPATNIGYFHVSLTFQFTVDNYTGVQFTCSNGAHFCTLNFFGTTLFTVSVTDGASTVMPNGTQAIIHTGKPVIACVLVNVSGSTNTWAVISAGDATALTIAAAASACQITSEQFLPDCDNTAIAVILQ